MSGFIATTKVAKILRVDVCFQNAPSQVKSADHFILQNLDDYNSWQESWWGRWRRSHLDKNVILAEGKPITLSCEEIERIF